MSAKFTDPQPTAETPPGTRVETWNVDYYFGTIREGSTGVVVSVSPKSHATAHGGGHDVVVDLDEATPRRVTVRSTNLRVIR